MTDAHLVLVTGAAGFIGATVVRQLVAAGVRVSGVDDLSAGDPARLEGLPSDLFTLVIGDSRDPELLDRLLAERPAAVLHLAGRVGVRRVLADPVLCESENLSSGEALGLALRRAARAGIAPRIVAASTSEVYAESSAPLGEESATRPLNAEGRWRYAASKRACEDILDQAARDVRKLVPGAPLPIHLRFFNVVGPGQDGSTGMVLPRFVEAARRGDPLEIHGTGKSVRTFAHVEAVARDVSLLTLPALARDPGGRAALLATSGPLNVGGDARATVEELARLVASEARQRTGFVSSLEYVDPRRTVAANFAEVAHRVPDLGRAQSLGLVASPWSLEAIVRDVVERHVAPRPATVLGDLLCASPAS